jgi:hypothetical protein
MVVCLPIETSFQETIHLSFSFLSFFDLKTFFLFYPKRFQLKNNIYFFFRKTIDFSMFDLIGVGIGGSGGGVYSKVYYSVVGGLNLK